MQNNKKRITVKIVTSGNEFSFGECKDIKNIFIHKNAFLSSEKVDLSEGDIVEGILKIIKNGKYAGKYRLEKCKKKTDNFLAKIKRRFLWKKW